MGHVGLTPPFLFQERNRKLSLQRVKLQKVRFYVVCLITNRSNEGYETYAIPADKHSTEKRQKWLCAIKKKDFNLTDSTRLAEIAFQSRMSKFLG